jgi:hypothetical protein
LELVGDLGQHIPADGEFLPVGREEADGSFRLLKRLNQTIQQNSVEATIVEPDAILVMFVKGVHGNLQSWLAIYLEAYSMNACSDAPTKSQNAWDIKGGALG